MNHLLIALFARATLMTLAFCSLVIVGEHYQLHPALLLAAASLGAPLALGWGLRSLSPTA